MAARMARALASHPLATASSPQWKESRFHGPYLVGAPCKPVVRRHATPGVIPNTGSTSV